MLQGKDNRVTMGNYRGFLDVSAAQEPALGLLAAQSISYYKSQKNYDQKHRQERGL